MTLYHYGDNSVLRKIGISKSAGGGVRAFLYAGGTATGEQIAAIKSLVKQEGWHCVATEKDGEYSLELRGVKDIEPLENALRAGGFIANRKPIALSDGIKLSATDKIRNNMLLVSGGLNMLADIGYIGYGYVKSKLPNQGKTNWEDGAVGAAYMTGSAALTLFGHGDKSDHHIRDISARLRDKLLLEGLDIPEHSAIRSFTAAQPGVVNHIRQFMEKHPSEIGNGSYAVAGGLIALGAHTNATDNKTKVTETILGLTTMASGLAPVLVKEKAKDPEGSEPRTALGKAFRWVQERPNRIAGYGYMVSTGAHAVETIRKLSDAKTLADPLVRKHTYQAYGMRGVFIAFNMISEVIMSLSSKGHGSGVKTNKSLDETACAITADAIVHQPPAAREKLIVNLGQFLAQEDMLGGKAQDIEAVLRARVSTLSRNPWSPAHSDAAAHASAHPSVIEQPAQTTPDSTWTNKALASASQKELSLSPAL